MMATEDLRVITSASLDGSTFAVRYGELLFVSPAVRSLLNTDGVATMKSLVVRDMAEVKETLQIALKALEN